MIWTLWLGAALAQDPALSGAVHGDLKSFFLATFPYDHLLMPEDPWASALLDGRVKATLQVRDSLKFEVHHEIYASGGSETTGLTSTGAAGDAPEIVDLGWEAVDADGLRIHGRTDRLWVRLHEGPVDITLGRQPVSFGTGVFFTPMDLVNPFTPATIDQEYKPGVDALRVEVYPSLSSRITAVAAYAGDWDLDGLVLAAHGQITLGVSDLALFAGLARGSPVFGLGAVSAIGPVGVHGDATVTLPDEETGAVITEPYVRAVLGADGRPGPKTTISGEIYLQSFGETEASEYLVLASDPRFATGELWAMGLLEAGLAISQEIRPTLFGSLALIANPLDPSAMLAPGLSWSAAENTDVVAGGYVGLGQRPDPVELTDLLDESGLPLANEDLLRALGVQSEYGLLPSTGYVAVKVYF